MAHLSLDGESLVPTTPMANERDLLVNFVIDSSCAKWGHKFFVVTFQFLCISLGIYSIHICKKFQIILLCEIVLVHMII